MTATVRQCRFAGQFFPADRQHLSDMVDGFLDKAARMLPDSGKTTMIVSPHAGYRFSGQLSALAFHAARDVQPNGQHSAPCNNHDNSYNRCIVILSPSHRHAFSGVAAPSQSVWNTPLGDLAIDQDSIEKLINSGLVKTLDAAHDNEHGIETQLPFIRRLWPRAQIIPLVVGKAGTKNLVHLLETLSRDGGGDGDGKDKTAGSTKNGLTVISTDLSHFLDNKTATKKDSITAQLIEQLSTQGPGPAGACGWSPLAAGLEFARRRGDMPCRLGMYNSSAVGGSSDRVVGYGAWQFLQAGEQRIPTNLRKACLQLARQVLTHRTEKGTVPEIARKTVPALLDTQMASFVTLNKGDRLRGCIGTCLPRQSLFKDICHNVVAAGFSDPRFKPLTANELAQLTIKIAVLSLPVPMTFSNEGELLAQLRPAVDGLILSDGQRRGVFLPAVWEKLPDPALFLNRLKAKAGLPPGYWSDQLRVDRFTSEDFGEAGSNSSH